MEQKKNAEEKIKYRIEGSFCANCAAKMERALSSEDGIGETTINFAAKTVFLPPKMMEQAQTIMDKIEPGVRLIPAQQKVHIDSEKEENKAGRKILRIILAGVLFLLGLVFSSDWHLTGREPLEYAVYLIAYILVGYEVLSKAAKNILRGAVFDENFLMSLATIGAIAIHQLPEAVGVMLFYSVGEYVEDRAVNNSRKSIQALLNVRPDYANLVYNLETYKVDPEDVQVGQQILVHPGEKIPLDGEIISGTSFVDTSALTGENVPRKVIPGETVLAGMINKSGLLTVNVIREFAESSVQKILDLVENASTRKARTEKFITTFSRYYTPGVVLIAAVIAFGIPLLTDGNFSDWLYRALTILVISCPCALVISVPLGYFGGIGGASRNGILVKGANYLEALTKVKTVVFDKTGTLTEGVFEVVKISPFSHYSEEALLDIAASAEVYSNHPIAQSVRKKYGKAIDKEGIEDYEEVSGKGTHLKLNGKEVLAGKADFLEQSGIKVPSSGNDETGTIVHLGVEGNYAGHLVIADRIKNGAEEIIRRLNQNGIKTVMLTGDHLNSGRAVAEKLGIAEFHADLLPEDKVTLLEKISGADHKGKTVFVGDGINDAPVLARADLGIAMGGLGSDAAIEASDVVLMEDQPEKIAAAMDIARYTKRIIWQNIGFALAIKIGFIILGIFGAANMWEAVFADVGVALLAILNSTRVWRYSKGNTSSFLQLQTKREYILS